MAQKLNWGKEINSRVIENAINLNPDIAFLTPD